MDSMHGTTPVNKDKSWVCLSDRRLALRAKLRCGWSVKSEPIQSRYADFTDTPLQSGNPNASTSGSQMSMLTEEERSTIVQVIQRAKAVEESEQERVGRLVQRLENMKKNVHTVTSARSSTRACGSRCATAGQCVCSCAICSEKFTMLGPSQNLCHDCRKYVCRKCGIEISPSYAMMAGSSASTSASTSAAAAASTSASSSTAPQPQSGFVRQLLAYTSRDNTEKLFLCRLCAETRDIWKKSGAWFSRCLPTYVLPEKVDRTVAKPVVRASWAATYAAKSEDLLDDSSSDDEGSTRMT